MNRQNVGTDAVWVFKGEGASHPAAVFSSLELAEAWIKDSGVSGILTHYPIDVSVYDWATQNKCFTPNEPHQRAPQFIGRFSSAYLDHYHYSDGRRVA